MFWPSCTPHPCPHQIRSDNQGRHSCIIPVGWCHGTDSCLFLIKPGLLASDWKTSVLYVHLNPKSTWSWPVPPFWARKNSSTAHNLNPLRASEMQLQQHRLNKFSSFSFSEIEFHYVALDGWNLPYRPGWSWTHIDHLPLPPMVWD